MAQVQLSNGHGLVPRTWWTSGQWHLLRRWTNGRWKAALHRAACPPASTTTPFNTGNCPSRTIESKPCNDYPLSATSLCELRCPDCIRKLRSAATYRKMQAKAEARFTRHNRVFYKFHNPQKLDELNQPLKNTVLQTRGDWLRKVWLSCC